MIRVAQTFACNHSNGKPALEIVSRGHSVALEDRVCFCTGKAVPMRREVRCWEPAEEKIPQ